MVSDENQWLIKKKRHMLPMRHVLAELFISVAVNAKTDTYDTAPMSIIRSLWYHVPELSLRKCRHKNVPPHLCPQVCGDSCNMQENSKVTEDIPSEKQGASDENNHKSVVLDHANIQLARYGE